MCRSIQDSGNVKSTHSSLSLRCAAAQDVGPPGLVGGGLNISWPGDYSSLRANPNPSPTQTLNLTKGRVGISPTTRIDPSIPGQPCYKKNDISPQEKTVVSPAL